MSTPDMYVSPALAIERAFVELLQRDPAFSALTIVAASDRDVRVPPLHCFVVCDRVTPLLPTGIIFTANVAVTVVTNMDDHTNPQRVQWADLLAQALSRQPLEYDSAHAHLKGWNITSVGEVSDGQQTGDAIRMTVGAAI